MPGGEPAAVGEPHAPALPDLFGTHLRAVLFDLDGVVTHTAAIHARAWKRLFDEFLRGLEGDPERLAPFRLPEDYLAYVDGKPRYQGVRSFLGSRAIDLPWGDPQDCPDDRTICGLGNRKDGYFNQVLDEQGVEVFPTTIALIRALRTRGVGTACVSSSKNCRPVLERAGITDLFDVIFDGRDLERESLAGKPCPDAFLRAAELLGGAPGEAAVVEDAVSGVAAGKAGGFRLVIGVDRGAGREALLAGGADVVVADLAELADALAAGRVNGFGDGQLGSACG
jgi:beta-phosphoglucomutase family hydrolase